MIYTKPEILAQNRIQDNYAVTAMLVGEWCA